MESQYKIIAYTAANKHTDEVCEYHADTFGWQDARIAAIELASLWKADSELENSYDGIQLHMTYGIEGDSEHTFIITLLTGQRMHSPEITQALWDEATALNYMEYNFDSTVLKDEKGAQSEVVTDKFIKLYYFTA
jgi:hypothetical protein